MSDALGNMALKDDGTGVGRSSLIGVEVCDLPDDTFPSVGVDSDGKRDWQVLGHSPLMTQKHTCSTRSIRIRSCHKILRGFRLTHSIPALLNQWAAAHWWAAKLFQVGRETQNICYNFYILNKKYVDMRRTRLIHSIYCNILYQYFVIIS